MRLELAGTLVRPNPMVMKLAPSLGAVVAQDNFERLVAAGENWGTPDIGPDWEHNEGPTTVWEVEDGVGKIVSPGLTQTSGRIPINVADVEVLGKIHWTNQAAGGIFNPGSLFLRIHPTTHHQDTYQAILRVSNTTQNLTLEIRRHLAAASSNLGTAALVSNYTPGDAWWIRFRAVGTSLKAKAWRHGTTEPSSWQVEVTDSNHTSGGVGYKYSFSSGNTVNPAFVSLDEFQAFDLGFSVPYFIPADYIALGYTHFDVICIGGGGGRGGGIDTAGAGTTVRNFGGEGGGGGFHRVRGLLSALPAACPVVVGAGGSDGADHASNPASTTDGGDGGYSSFNDTTCRASGGEGGKRAQSNSTTVTTDADGGDGGIGNRIIAGGGAAGGLAGTPTATGPGTPGTNGADGTFAQNIGEGGGGGAGGVGTYADVTCNAATSGGKGSYNPGDTSVYGPGGTPSSDAVSGAASIVPGTASGAKASPLNGLPTIYGKSGEAGAVIIRLTAE